MAAVIEGGWLQGVAQVPSPNFDVRPSGSVIELVVIHGISLPPGCYGGNHVAHLFTNQLEPTLHPYFEQIADARVSAHLLVERNGAITQFVSFNDRAWHAGVSSFEGRDRCNDFSIGIELEGTDAEPYTEVQYVVLNQVLQALATAYPIRALRGHCDVAPGRKTDPGPYFDWQRIDLPWSISRPPTRA
jgi:AmpD protein